MIATACLVFDSLIKVVNYPHFVTVSIVTSLSPGGGKIHDFKRNSGGKNVLASRHAKKPLPDPICCHGDSVRLLTVAMAAPPFEGERKEQSY